MAVLGAGNVLSSDAEVSYGISAEGADFQPMKVWYGSRSHRGEPNLFDQQAACLPPTPVNYLLALDSDHFPKGAGTTIAILDSGINTQHTAFTGRISPASKSFVSHIIIPLNPSVNLDIEDRLGHGTQCAGLACGSKVSFTLNGIPKQFEGIAQEAKLMVCKVVPYGTTTADIGAVIQALQYILDYNTLCLAKNQVYDRVSVVAISFGMSKYSHLLSKKILEVIHSDIVVVCAASNSGRQYKQSIMYPARLGHVLCIGSCNSDGRHSSFSPGGRELDFLAPGEKLWAPTIGGPGVFSTVQGTSFAAPLVAGLVCQIIQDLRDLSATCNQPWIIDQLHNVWGMREIMKEMSVIRGTHKEDEGFGVLTPREYFEKTPNEKITLLSNIV